MNTQVGDVQFGWQTGVPDSITKTMSVSEFKATCLELIDAMHAGTIRGITLTKRGKPFVSLVPSPGMRPSDRLFGALAGSVTVPAELDLTAPVVALGSIDALREEPLV